MDEIIALRDKKEIFVRNLSSKKNDKTLLYLHGGPGEGCENFSYAAQLLSQYYNIILFDQRGVLRSQKVEEDEILSVEMLIDDIEDLRQIYNINALHLIGHSYGGFLASLYALKYPNNIKAIVYENPGWNMINAIKTIHKNTIPFIREGGDNELADKIEKAIAINNDLDELCMLQNETPEKYRVKVYYNKPWSDELKEFYKGFNVSDDQINNSQRHAKRIIADKINERDFLPLLRDINCPSLLIRGDHDPVMSKEYEKFFLNNTQLGYLKIIQDSGHTIHMDQPKEFCNCVVDFLRTV